jgi:hypothetical protein
MATKNQIEANRRNSQKSPGPEDTTKTRHNATTHALYAAGITKLDKAEGFEELLAGLVAEHKPVGLLENYRVYCMARDMIRQIRGHRLESQFLERVLQPQFHDSHADDNSASGSKRPTVEYRITSQLAPSVLETVVTTYHRCEAFYANHLSRCERDLERLQRIRLGEHLPAPVGGQYLGLALASNNLKRVWCATQDSAPDTDEAATHVPVPLHSVYRHYDEPQLQWDLPEG